MSAGARGGPVWWTCCIERPEPTAAIALTADQWANQAGMGGAMCTARQAVATGAYPVKDGRREGEAQWLAGRAKRASIADNRSLVEEPSRLEIPRADRHHI